MVFGNKMCGMCVCVCLVIFFVRLRCGVGGGRVLCGVRGGGCALALENACAAAAVDREFGVLGSADNVTLGVLFGPWIPVAQHVRLNELVPNEQ